MINVFLNQNRINLKLSHRTPIQWTIYQIARTNHINIHTNSITFEDSNQFICSLINKKH